MSEGNGRAGNVVVAIMVIVAAVTAYLALSSQSASASGNRINQPTILSTATIDQGDLILTVAATGSMATAQTSNLTFPAGVSGIVTNIVVPQGQTVTAGQVLANIDNSSEQAAVKQAQLNLEASQAALNKLLEPVDPNTIAVAQSQVKAAQGSLLGKESTTTTADITVYQARLQAAQASKADADKLLQDAGGHYKNSDPNYQLALAQDGEAGFNVAMAQLNLQEAQKGTPIGAAQANIAYNQAKLAQTLAGPAQIDIDAAQATVVAAQDQLDQANHALVKTILVAPYDGVITTINAQVGQPAQGTAMIITNINSLYASVNVDESDITSITSGEPVSFTVDALPGITITGKVNRVIPIADVTASVITYPVQITLDTTKQLLRAGMTLNATFAVKQVKNVVRVPNNFIKLDSTTGQNTVSIVNPDGVTVRTVPIQIGLQGADYTEVLQGLKPGDTVALVSQTTTTQRGA
jgi:HlyD family secretion protein